MECYHLIQPLHALLQPAHESRHMDAHCTNKIQVISTYSDLILHALSLSDIHRMLGFRSSTFNGRSSFVFSTVSQSIIDILAKDSLLCLPLPAIRSASSVQFWNTWSSGCYEYTVNYMIRSKVTLLSVWIYSYVY